MGIPIRNVIEQEMGDALGGDKKEATDRIIKEICNNWPDIVLNIPVQDAAIYAISRYTQIAISRIKDRIE